MNRARPSRLILAAFAIAWLAVGLSATSVFSQAPPPTAVATTLPAATTVPAAPPASGLAIEAGDPRSEGQGPGLVGEPLLVLAGIILVGLGTVIATIAIARATGRA